MNRKYKTFINVGLTVIFILYFLLLFFRVLTTKTSMVFWFTLGFVSLAIGVVFFKSFFKSEKQTVIKTVIANFWLYVENTLVLDFLNKKSFWNKLFYKVLLLTDYFMGRFTPKRITICVIYIPWIIFLCSFGLEILVLNQLSITFYFLAFSFFFKRIYLLFLYISLVKFYTLERTSFQRYFSCFTEIISNFFMKNFLFRLDILFYQNLSNNTKIFLWKVLREIDYFYLNRSKVFYLRSMIPIIESFILRINLIIFGSILFYLLIYELLFMDYWFLLILYILFLYLLLFFQITSFLSTKHVYEELFIDLLQTFERRTFEDKIALVEKYGIKESDLNLTFKLDNSTLLSKRDLIYQKILFYIIKGIQEDKSYDSEILSLSQNLDISQKIPLTIDEINKLNKVLRDYVSWFDKTLKEGRINPLTFEYKYE